MSDNRERFAFLGREFLTWLWFESETHNGIVQCDGIGQIGIEFGQKLVLETGGNIREGSSVQAEAPALAEEARVALRVGKKVSRARLTLAIGDKSFQVGIDAETFTLSGAKLPTLMAGEDAQRMEERLHLLDELENILDSLYVAFVRLRMDAQSWTPLAESMRAWVLQPAPI